MVSMHGSVWSPLPWIPCPLSTHHHAIFLVRYRNFAPFMRFRDRCDIGTFFGAISYQCDFGITPSKVLPPVILTSSGKVSNISNPFILRPSISLKRLWLTQFGHGWCCSFWREFLKNSIRCNRTNFEIVWALIVDPERNRGRKLSQRASNPDFLCDSHTLPHRAKCRIF